MNNIDCSLAFGYYIRNMNEFIDFISYLIEGKYTYKLYSLDLLVLKKYSYIDKDWFDLYRSAFEFCIMFSNNIYIFFNIS